MTPCNPGDSYFVNGPYFHKTPWPVFTYQGVAYTLTHLDECVLDVLDSKGTMRHIAVTFSDHCFTRSPKPGDDPQLFYPGCSRNPGHFCVERYQHSLTISGHLQQAVIGKVWHVEEEHYAIVPTVDHQGNPMLYGIIFSLDKVKGLPVHLHMRIKSAHPRDQKDITTYGDVRFRHLVTLRMEGKRPPRIMDARRKRPMVKVEDKKK